MPTKIKAAHLPAFAREFDLALREGVITIVEAREFCTNVYIMALEQQVRNGEKVPVRPITPEGNQHAEEKRTKRTDDSA